MKVVIIGTGNVAHVLGDSMVAAGHEIIEIAGRNPDHVKSLADIFQCHANDNLGKINLTADLYLIAVADNSIEAVAKNIRVYDRVVVHTAGSVFKDVLHECSENFGVIYPLQSLRKGLNHKPIIPVLIEGNNDLAKETIKTFAETWASTVQFATDEERLKTHVAAVVVNNFTNHLLTIADQYCKEEKLNFSLLYPLIEETVHRLQFFAPSTVQTGPAIRHDFVTIEKHLSILANHHFLRELYKMFSSNIMDFYSKDDKD